MKIGVLTFHWADNYGAVLQAYALIQWINKNTSSSAEIINYICKGPAKIYTPFFFTEKGVIGFFHGLLRCTKNLIQWKRKHDKFCKFRQQMSISNRISKRQLLNYEMDYDIWITGSDQVWNLNIVGDDIEIYDLSFVKKGKKLSYSASSCILDPKSEGHKQFIEALKNLDEISVREKSTQQCLSQYLNKDIYHVVDPTFLLDKSEWLKIMPSNRILNKPYMLIYCVSYDHILIDTVKMLSEIIDIDVVVCGDIKELRSSVICLRSPSPQDFLNLIYYADFVIASSFHATAFSLIFRKQFVSIMPSYASNRVEDLCEMAGCPERVIINPTQAINLFAKPIDYEKVIQNIEPLIKFSKDFLVKSIEQYNKEININGGQY